MDRIRNPFSPGAGSPPPELAGREMEVFDLPLGQWHLASRFSDGEIQINIKENIRGRDVLVVQSICRPPNRNGSSRRSRTSSESRRGMRCASARKPVTVSMRFSRP